MITRFLCGALLTLSLSAFGGEAARGARPNFIFIMADDLGYNDVSCYGQTQFSTPNIDRMAAEGMRFTSAYTSAPLCAPCRATLLTGLHNGHSPIRGNPSQARGYDRTVAGDPPLPADIPTFPKIFRDAGYATAAIGKYGMGRADAAGNPRSIGFDYFFGYESHTAAHDYYPQFLWRNHEKVPLDGKTYTHDLFTEETLAFIRKHKDRPFFLYLPYTIPHVALNPPTLEPYADKPWPKTARAYAAMIHRMDADIGRIIALLKELKLDENTLVIFTSDNGPESAGGHSSAFFSSGAPFRGQKNGPYEGGIRVPFIARWPGRVPAAVTTAQPVVHYDMVATAAEFVGVPAPAGTDGLSILPTLLNDPGRQKQHEYFYWALGETKGGFQEVRLGRWKAELLGVSSKPEPTVELYDLETDLGQKRNVAAEHPDIVQRVRKIAAEAHTPNAMFPLTYAECQAAAPKGMRPWPDKADKKTKKAK